MTLHLSHMGLTDARTFISTPPRRARTCRTRSLAGRRMPAPSSVRLRDVRAPVARVDWRFDGCPHLHQYAPETCAHLSHAFTCGSTDALTFIPTPTCGRRCDPSPGRTC